MYLKLPYPPQPEYGASLAASGIELVHRVTGIQLDGSVASLFQVDEILEGFHRDRARVEDLGPSFFMIGCYVGEVFVRHAGGRWIDTETTILRGTGDMPILIALPNGSACNPIGKCFKRVANGSEDSIPNFFWVSANPGGVNAQPKPWWKLW